MVIWWSYRADFEPFLARFEVRAGGPVSTRDGCRGGQGQIRPRALAVTSILARSRSSMKGSAGVTSWGLHVDHLGIDHLAVDAVGAGVVGETLWTACDSPGQTPESWPNPAGLIPASGASHKTRTIR